MSFFKSLDKLAELAVYVGVNVQKGQTVVVRSNTESRILARKIVKKAYEAGAKKVIVDWSDTHVSRESYLNMDLETLKEVPQYAIDKARSYVDENACFINITSPMPGLLSDVDSMKVQQAARASQEKMKFLREHTMGNQSQWTIIGAANKLWAKKVFPELRQREAINALWQAIFDATRIDLEEDVKDTWKSHNKNLKDYADLLNKYAFEKLHFKNSLGTDLTVGLVEDHIWVAGGETAANGVYFNPNLPTEEAFTMPHKFMTEGKVVATKPLHYNGKLIEDFWVRFEKGKVVEFDAATEKETLEAIINFDENSGYIGEIALISYDSPISNSNILFYNTLFDENASCHMALGRAYPMNVKDGIGAPIEKLEEKGFNNSLIHVDFMFGSSDLEIIGITKDNKKIQVFKEGNFIIKE